MRTDEGGPIRSAREPRRLLYGRHRGRLFSTRQLTVGGRTYEADADGKVYSVERGQRRRVRDPGILRRIDQQLRAESAARTAAEAAQPAGAESEARRAGREAARRAMQAAAGERGLAEEVAEKFAAHLPPVAGVGAAT